MNLHPEPFEMIKSGEKTIELRLSDEKRSLIEIEDTIVFTNTKHTDKMIEVKVLKIHYFDSFDSLYSVLPLDKCGYRLSELPSAKASDMLPYYSREKQNKYGVLGIEVEGKN